MLLERNEGLLERSLVVGEYTQKNTSALLTLEQHFENI